MKLTKSKPAVKATSLNVLYYCITR